jgi:endonuclease YncB( thermonuclease family)
MSTGLERTWFKFALVALLAVGGLTDAALAQELDASRVARAGSLETQTNAFSARNAKTLSPFGNVSAAEETSAPKIVKLPSFSHQAPGGRVELIHLPTFSAAGSIEKGSNSIRLTGVVITAVDAQCGSGPDAWPCGRMARAALQRLVRGRSVECRISVTDRLVDGVSHCSVGGKDIGKWLVAQGWASAIGPEYRDAEKTAREEKRGAWSPVRPLFAQRPVFEAGPAPNDAAVRAEVHLSTQSMTLVHRDRIVGHWPVSTARNGKETPTGVWTAKWLSRHHRSSRYDNAPMPYSIFYDGDYAVHGTYQTARLGRPASAGCVRLSPEHAAVLFNLVRKEGLSNTLIVIRQ